MTTRSFCLRLLPHLRQGLRAGHLFRRVQDNERILLDTLDVMPIGIALARLLRERF